MNREDLPELTFEQAAHVARFMAIMFGEYQLAIHMGKVKPMGKSIAEAIKELRALTVSLEAIKKQRDVTPLELDLFITAAKDIFEEVDPHLPLIYRK